MRLSLFIIAAALAGTLQANAQQSSTSFDSLAIVKPRPNRIKYETTLPAFSEVALRLRGPKRVSNHVGQAVSDVTRSLFSGLIRGSVTGSQNADWLMRGKIETKRDDLSWQVDLFCPGEMEKTTDWERNSDGSRTKKTFKKVTLFWQNNATGVIMQDKDSLGWFQVRINPLDDTVFRQKGMTLLAQVSGGASAHFASGRLPVPNYLKYALLGKFRGQDLQLLFDGDDWIGWIFLNGELQGVFRSDKEMATDLIAWGKKSNRLMPYLLYKAGLQNDGLADCLRLAFMSRFVMASVYQDVWTEGDEID